MFFIYSIKNIQSIRLIGFVILKILAHKKKGGGWKIGFSQYCSEKKLWSFINAKLYRLDFQTSKTSSYFG